MKKIIYYTMTLILVTINSMAMDRISRLGIGVSHELQFEQPSISFKLQRSKIFSFGGIINLNSGADNSSYGFGLKMYRHIFDEPQLNFYAFGLAALTSQNDKAGFQFDFGIGSEFYITGLKSIGFSFETGISLNKIGENFVIETVGHSFYSGSVHFYL